MSAADFIIQRSSAPRLVEPGPNPADLETILAAGSRAPDHGRLRPFRFVVIEGGARDQFGELMLQSMLAREPAASDAAKAAERQKPLRAPTIVVVAARLQDHPKVPEIEQILAAGAAAQNLMLAAHALGYGASWKTGPAAYDADVKQGLGLKVADAIVGFIYIGTSKVPMPPKTIDLEPLVTRL